MTNQRAEYRHRVMGGGTTLLHYAWPMVEAMHIMRSGTNLELEPLERKAERLYRRMDPFPFAQRAAGLFLRLCRQRPVNADLLEDAMAHWAAECPTELALIVNSEHIDIRVEESPRESMVYFHLRGEEPDRRVVDRRPVTAGPRQTVEYALGTLDAPPTEWKKAEAKDMRPPPPGPTERRVTIKKKR